MGENQSHQSTSASSGNNTGNANQQKSTPMSYEKIFELSRLEKKRDELQQLEHDFFAAVADFMQKRLDELGEIAHRTDIESTAKAQRMRRDIENIQKLVKEIYDKRESKILDIALTKTRTKTHMANTSLMLPQEKEFYDDLLDLLAQYREEILDKMVHGTAPVVEKDTIVVEKKKSDGTAKVKILENLPEFVGEDLETYGPFSKSQVVVLPEGLAQLLRDQKKAELLRIE